MIPINISLWEEAEENLPIQFYDKTNVRELLSQYISQIQIGNDFVFNILDTLNVTLATGYLLDCVGSYVAVLRNADEDEAYRDRIKRAILIASSEGTPNELLTLLGTITRGNTQIWEHFPFSTTLSTDGWEIPKNLAKFIQEASPATSGEVVVYLNPFKNGFKPTELGFDVLKLANQDLTPFATEIITPTFLTVNVLDIGAGLENSSALLSEFTYGIDNGIESATPDGLGILCEIAFQNGGIIDYKREYLELDNSIFLWNVQMNYTTPLQFT